MNKEEIKKIIKPENGIEEAIISNVDFITGVNYGKPRPGHCEGLVIYHIKEVLENIVKFYSDNKDYEKLRVIAITHDSFKYKVDRSKPKSGENHHGMIARRFTEKFTPADYDLLQVIQRHDDAYNAWSKGDRNGDWIVAERRINALIMGLIAEDIVDLYTKFYHCDNKTGNKSQECFNWFLEHIK